MILFVAGGDYFLAVTAGLALRAGKGA